MHRGRKTAKIKVTPQLPICQECPWKMWCKQLNFRTMPPAGKGETMKVCPIWWAIMNYMREKGITPKGPPKDLSIKQAHNRYDQLKRQRKERLGFGA